MSIVSRMYVEKGPGNGDLHRFVSPTVNANERYRSPVILIDYDDSEAGIVEAIDEYMDTLGYDSLSNDLQIEIFARVGGNPGAKIGRSRLYGVNLAGATRALVRDSDGLISQLTPLIRDSIAGCSVSWTSVSTVTIGTGTCRDKADSLTILVTVPLLANIAIAGAGGLDTGVETSNTFYSVFVIADSTGVLPPNSLLSTGGDNPTLLPPGYDVYRRVGYVRNNPSSDFREFVSYGKGSERSIQYRDALSSRQQLVGGSATVVTAINCGSLIPNSSAYGRFQLAQRGTVVASFYDDPTQLLANAQRSLLAGNTSCDVLMRVSASQRIAYANAAAGGLVDVWVLGYEEQL